MNWLLLLIPAGVIAAITGLLALIPIGLAGFAAAYVGTAGLFWWLFWWIL